MNLTTVQQTTLTLVPQDALGNVVPVTAITGSPAWNSSNVNAVSLVVAANGLTATAAATGIGSSTISTIASALGSQISGSILITVTQAPPVQLSISASAPVLI